MKHPGGTGKLKPNQRQFLDDLEQQNWKTMVSDSYDDILVELIEYVRDVRLKCKYCNQRFKNDQSPARHCKFIHRIPYGNDEDDDD